MHPVPMQDGELQSCCNGLLLAYLGIPKFPEKAHQHGCQEGVSHALHMGLSKCMRGVFPVTGPHWWGTHAQGGLPWAGVLLAGVLSASSEYVTYLKQDQSVRDGSLLAEECLLILKMQCLRIGYQTVTPI